MADDFRDAARQDGLRERRADGAEDRDPRREPRTLTFGGAHRFVWDMSGEMERAYQGRIHGNAHYFALRVYIEDTDLGGVVYHANYLRFLERARSDMLRAVGIDQRGAIEKGVGVYAVAELQIKYRRPARLDDELVVVSRLEEVRGVSCIIDQKISRGDELIAEATVTAAFDTPQGRPRRQPVDWVEKFKNL
jgi:acyl-CoA thioester hydrolase